ncbi:MAG: hypothetical protein ACI9QA_000182 [Methanobacteriota archaeon]|jgi:hypothetical protein
MPPQTMDILLSGLNVKELDQTKNSYLRIPKYTVMSKSVRISEEFHEFVRSHSRDDETMEETLRRLIGGPDPEAVAGILSSETAEGMRERIEERRDDGKRELRERFE